MADKMTNSNSFSFSIDFARNNEANSRNFTVEVYNTGGNPRNAAAEFRSLLLGKFNKFLQPTNWRDADIAEEEWTTVAVKVKFIAKTETEFDFPVDES